MATMRTFESQCVTEIDFDNLEHKRRHDFDLVVSSLNVSKDACVPVSVIVGGAPGKRLTLIAGVHGDEAEGVATLFDLIEELDPAQVAGQVVIVPIANPGAFIAGLRRDPVDDVDLNRTFPGDAHGTVTERLAHALFEKLVRHADFVLSMHGWSATGATLPYVEYAGWESKTAAQSLAAAASAGFDLIWDCPWPAGMMMEVLVRAGVPGLEAEIGGLGTTTREGRERYRRHIVELIPNCDEQDSSQFVVRSIATQAFLAVARARRRACQPAMSFTQCRLVLCVTWVFMIIRLSVRRRAHVVSSAPRISWRRIMDSWRAT